MEHLSYQGHLSESEAGSPTWRPHPKRSCPADCQGAGPSALHGEGPEEDGWAAGGGGSPQPQDHLQGAGPEADRQLGLCGDAADPAAPFQRCKGSHGGAGGAEGQPLEGVAFTMLGTAIPPVAC